ncbi:MAG: hypothetical protein MK008_14855 [Bdellovibrionales bacterium]|nr:hypothetical protein [Bdellovibrionales bacterium]
MSLSNRGQTLLLVLLVAGLLSGMLMFSAGFIKWTQVKNHTESLCRRHYLKAQSYVVKYAKRIKKLNPKATKLRFRLGVLYAKLALMKDPVSISATLWQIKKVKSKQKLLHAKQKGLIEMARYKIALEVSELKKELVQKHTITPLKLSDVHFNMEAKPINSTAPTYHLPPQFYKTQTASASWTWMDFDFFKGFFNFSCSVGVKKKGLKWKPALKKDSPLLSYL